MKLLKKLVAFLHKKEPSLEKWNYITTEKELKEVILSSNESTKVIFKHSNRCSVSYMSKRNIDPVLDRVLMEGDFYLIDVISNREISNKISDLFKIRHESPQLLLLKNGEVKWYGSHGSVTSQNLIDAVNKIHQ